MNTTKRKFNALLNGLGTKSNSSLSQKEKDVNKTPEKPNNDTDSQKKPRISYSSTNAKRLSTITKVSSAGPTEFEIPHRNSTSVATPSAETPKYAPWDRTEFLKRLKSFSNLTDWTPKPARVNEVEWAKRGWVCQKKERVRCCLCNVEILVKLNKKQEEDGEEKEVYIAENIENALVNKYVELIVTSHEENCLWRKRGCDDLIFKLPLSNTQVTMQNLRERYDEIQSRAEHLPYLYNMQAPDGLDIDLATSYLPKDFLKSPLQVEQTSPSAISTEVNKVSLMLALCGWQGHKHDRLGPQLQSISCQTCYRILGLWMFKSKEVNQAGEEVEGAIFQGLDPISQHREYCPWRNAVSQNGVEAASKSKLRALAGWEVVLRVLKNDHQLRIGREKGDKASRRSYVANTGHDSEDLNAPDFADDDSAKSIRDAKDKEIWARLRRVKTIFEPKKLKRTGSEKSKKSATT